MSDQDYGFDKRIFYHQVDLLETYVHELCGNLENTHHALLKANPDYKGKRPSEHDLIGPLDISLIDRPDE